MGWNRWIRRIHRWLSIAFTLGFIVNALAILIRHAQAWMYVLVLAPLFLLLFTGLYLFALPYFTRPSAR